MIHFIEVSKYYGNRILFDQANCHIPMSSFNCLIAANSTGKTTFFNLVFNQELPDGGQILFLQHTLGQLKKNKLAEHRRHIGIIRQEPLFLRKETVETNIMLPLAIAGKAKHDAALKVNEIAETLNLLHCLKSPIGNLSPGKKQLVSIARALVHEPILILADEPIQHLQQDLAKIAMELLYQAYKKGTTVVLASQRNEILSYSEANVFVIEQYQILRV
ncbi:MAG: ATP-binding cassette domain-containing protein [SAR324 cluster bacterium]|nr:ATP-binding cassette domain-containing protein [SAR324 cluster bacterium]